MLQEQIKILESLLEEKVCEDNLERYEAFQQVKGATDEELDKLEKHFSIKLPQDFREFYKYKNGSGYHFHILHPTYFDTGYKVECQSCYYLYSLEEIIKEKEDYFDDDELMSDEWEDEEDYAHIDSRIKPYFNNKKWIPFAQLAGGSLYLFLDYDPTDKGKEAQIITFVHDPDFVYYIAENFTEMLKQSNINLKNSEDGIVY